MGERAMPDLPLVSVIIPVWNGEKSIAQTLDSATSQTWRNIEFLVVDDGSTDKTRAILEGRARADPRIRIFTQPNGGVARARNRGLSEARGEFIAPLDADDLWTPDKIERQVQRMTEAGDHTGLVYCRWVWIDSSGAVFDHSPDWGIEARAPDLLLEVNFIGNASVPLYRRSCLEAVGGYDETLERKGARGCEDWDVALKVAERYAVAVVPEFLVGYRKHEGSMSTSRGTMCRSHQLMVDNLRHRRQGFDTALGRRSADQFALYLAGAAFRSGAYPEALHWGFRAWRSPLPWIVLPYVVRMISNQIFGSRKHPAQTMLPGLPLDLSRIDAPLIPYDRIYQRRIRKTGGAVFVPGEPAVASPVRGR